MSGVLSPHIASQSSELRKQFDSAKPFRHVVVDGFLQPDFCRALVDQFPAFQPEQARNEIGEVGRKAVHQNLTQIGPAYAQLDQLLQDPAFLKLTGEITGIPKLLYDPEYVGGGTHENLDGQDLDTHVDLNYHPATRLHRRLNLIVFLNPEWREEWGGLLELGEQAILPVENRCVIFETTESSWHGFRRITLPEHARHLSRKSIAVYYYTKDRPTGETAPSHGTLYVQRPMPEFVQAGHTLDERDVHELELGFARRDAHIKYLYVRELEFSRIAHSPAFRIARALTWPLRQIRALFPLIGIFIAFMSAQPPPSSGAFLLRGGTVHTISGPMIENGSVLVRDGRIIGVGKNLAAPEGVQIIDIPGRHVYPGMIDSAAAPHPSSEQIQAARVNGVTSVIEMLHPPVRATEHDDDEVPAPVPKRAFKRYLEESLRHSDGSAPLVLTAVRESEIREAIAFADKHKIRIVLADAYEAYKVLPLIKSRNIPVILGPTLSLPLDQDDPYDRSYTTPGDLFKAGIKFCIATFSARSIRNLPYQAATAAAFGLPQDQAYRAVSLSAAEVLGLSQRLGSIDEGKTADLIVTDGDPLEATTHVTLEFINGKSVSLETRQKQLYEKYRTLPY